MKVHLLKLPTEQEMDLLYVVNNLPYIKNVEGKEFSTNFVIACALDEITSMKILSRIEGDETKVSVQFLTELENVIKEGLEKIVKKAMQTKSLLVFTSLLLWQN